MIFCDLFESEIAALSFPAELRGNNLFKYSSVIRRVSFLGNMYLVFADRTDSHLPFLWWHADFLSQLEMLPCFLSRRAQGIIYDYFDSEP